MKNTRWALPLLTILMASLAEGRDAETAVKQEFAVSAAELKTEVRPAAKAVADEERVESATMGTETAITAHFEGLRPAKANQAGDNAIDEAWLGTVWAQVDEMVRPKVFWLQPVLTTSGVRGGEAEDRILGKLYYKGNPADPTSSD
jgi:hypothetical protein